MNEFRSARGKLARAEEHLTTLWTEWNEFRERANWGVYLTGNADRTEYGIHLELKEPSLFDRWSHVVGDCIHNLRACLDNAIYGLAVVKSGVDPPPHERVLAFPICQEAGFDSSLYKLGDMRSDPDVMAVIRMLQPYNRQVPPLRPALWLLQELDDHDKHHAVTLVCATPTAANIELLGLPEGVGGIAARGIVNAPLEDGIELMHVTLNGAAPGMYVKHSFTFEPSITHTAHDDGNGLSQAEWLLSYMRDEVAFSLAAIEALAR